MTEAESQPSLRQDVLREMPIDLPLPPTTDRPYRLPNCVYADVRAPSNNVFDFVLVMEGGQHLRVELNSRACASIYESLRKARELP